MRRMPLFALLAIVLALVVGCSSETDPPEGEAGSGGSGGTGGSDDPGGSGGSGGSGGGIVDPNDGPDVGWTPHAPASYAQSIEAVARDGSCGSQFGWVSAIRGWVAAPGGAALSGALAQACLTGSDDVYSCLSPVEANAEGVFTIDMPAQIRCLGRAALRVWQPNSGRASHYQRLGFGDDPVVRLDDPIVLPWATPAIDLPPMGDPDAVRPVVFDDGLVLQVIPSIYWSSGSGTYEKFGGRRIPNDAVGLPPGGSQFEGLYAFFPEGELVEDGEPSPGFPLTIPNVTGMQAGVSVEFFVLGGLGCRLLDSTPVGEGDWVKFGEGLVSADGTTISSNLGAGMPCFNWLAYRSN